MEQQQYSLSGYTHLKNFASFSAIQSGVSVCTMTSLELVAFINELRSPSVPELRHDHFMVKVPKVLGESHAPKFLGTQVYGNNNTRHIYKLPKREACLMAMSYSYELQAKVFDRMTAMEQSAQAQEVTIDSHEGALLTLQQLTAQQLVLIQENKRTAAELALAAPKVEFVDRYVQPGTGSMGFREVCKVLAAKEREFRQFLLERGVMYLLGGKLAPRAEHMQSGRFEAKTGTAKNAETSHAYVHYKFSPKGVIWIAGLWSQHTARLAQQVEVEE